MTGHDGQLRFSIHDRELVRRKVHNQKQISRGIDVVFVRLFNKRQCMGIEPFHRGCDAALIPFEQLIKSANTRDVVVSVRCGRRCVRISSHTAPQPQSLCATT